MANPPKKADALQPDINQGMFAPPKQMGRPSGDLTEQMMSSIRRLRILEERTSLLHGKTQVVEQNMLSNSKRAEDEIKKIQQTLIELRTDVIEVKNTIKMVVTEMQSAAKRQDVETLKKYITLWEPLNFVTRNEVQKLIAEALEEQQEQR
ncbi:MAG: hypothetical protein EPN86_05555 [Nanoarchaeota archaeon]|nr:MAG: hypothetical protein EPN86_05555 [Nanoarchaeota archaeon]